VKKETKDLKPRGWNECDIKKFPGTAFTTWKCRSNLFFMVPIAFYLYRFYILVTSCAKERMKNFQGELHKQKDEIEDSWLNKWGLYVSDVNKIKYLSFLRAFLKAL
jgi:hypothetical protein